jgi:hypothetical protein
MSKEAHRMDLQALMQLSEKGFSFLVAGWLLIRVESEMKRVSRVLNIMAERMKIDSRDSENEEP